MFLKERLKAEIDYLDEHYLELLFKIVCQFPHAHQLQKTSSQEEQIATLLQEIADSGGLDIRDPSAWQRDIRQDRVLPFREP